MSFDTVVRHRDDGDYDVIIAIQTGSLQDELGYVPDTWTTGIVEYLNNCVPNETFSVVVLVNVTDIIEAEYVDE